MGSAGQGWEGAAAGRGVEAMALAVTGAATGTAAEGTGTDSEVVACARGT